MFGENTREKRHKFQQDVNDTHVLFKDFIHQNRAQIDIEKVATGEHWYGTQALDLKLVDSISTSDDYLLAAAETADIYQVTYTHKKSLSEKVSGSMSKLIARLTLAFQAKELKHYL